MVRKGICWNNDLTNPIFHRLYPATLCPTSSPSTFPLDCLWLSLGFHSSFRRTLFQVANVSRMVWNFYKKIIQSINLLTGRMALLITLFLVLVNIFNNVNTNSPKAEGLTAIEVWMLACILFVFGKFLLVV